MVYTNNPFKFRIKIKLCLEIKTRLFYESIYTYELDMSINKT